MSSNNEKITYLKKSIAWHEVSNNRFIQILVVVSAIYITVKSYEHRTEFDACYEHAVDFRLHESQQGLQTAKNEGSDAEISYRLKMRRTALTACTQKD